MATDARLRRITKDDDSCDKCQFNLGDICAGFGERRDNGELTFGMGMEQAKAMFPNGCEEYKISFGASEEKA